MKEKILKLREEGKTYNEIVNLLGCSKSTVSYYCGKGQKEKTLKRTRKRRKNILLKKVENFRDRHHNPKNFVESIRKFNKRKGHDVESNLDMNFNYKDVIKKFGVKTTCYLTGEEIDLTKDGYELDHIVPVSRGGSNKLSNLGILTKKVNSAKSDMLVEEFIELCNRVTLNNINTELV